MGWQYSLKTFVWVFPVGRGNAVFVRTGLNQGFIVDMGSGVDFDPAEFIENQFLPKLDPYKKRKIAQAVLSHPHSDHISQCERLGSGSTLHPELLTCPHDKNKKDGTDSGEKLNWNRIKNPKGTEELLEAYRSLYAKRELPLQTIEFKAIRSIPNLEYGIYYVRPSKCEKLHPSDDNQYGNCTSIVFYLRHGQHSILLPGDMTPEGMEHVLGEREGTEKRFTVFSREAVVAHPNWHYQTFDQPSLKWLLRTYGLSILVAPHHGLESCFSTDLYGAIRGGKPQLVVISERRHKHENDGKTDTRYQSQEGASSLDVDTEGTMESRRSVNTVNGHHILVCFSGTGSPKVFLDRNPKNLLKKMDD